MWSQICQEKSGLKSNFEFFSKLEQAAYLSFSKPALRTTVQSTKAGSSITRRVTTSDKDKIADRALPMPNSDATGNCQNT